MKYIALILSLLATPVIAQPQCDNRENVISGNKDIRGRVAKYRGIDPTGLLLEIWEKDGAYIVTLTNPEGVTCIIGGGHALKIGEAA